MAENVVRASQWCDMDLPKKKAGMVTGLTIPACILKGCRAQTRPASPSDNETMTIAPDQCSPFGETHPDSDRLCHRVVDGRQRLCDLEYLLQDLRACL
jgi:hypothetical protein